jgi:hypothetical protein
MNAAPQTAGQLTDDRKPATAPDGFRCRAIVRDGALYDVAYKHQLYPQFRVSSVELRMSCHVGQQLGYNQPKLPAAFSFKAQIIRWKQDTYRQAVQSVFRDSKAKLVKVPRGIGKPTLIRDVQRPMNIGVLMQEVHDVEERGLDGDATWPTALVETVYIAEVSSFLILWFNSRRSNDPSGFGNGTTCFVISCSRIVSDQNEAKHPSRFRSDRKCGSRQLAQPMTSDRSFYGSKPRRSNSASIASKTISAGITASDRGARGD